MQIPMGSSDLRRWAMQCTEEANNPRASGEERDRLMKMREGLLALAENQDWLNGKIDDIRSERSGNIHYLDLAKPRQV